MRRSAMLSMMGPGSWLTIAFTLFVGLMLWDSFGLSRASAWIPQAILLITLLLLLWQLATEFVTGRYAAPSPDAHPVPALMAVAWIGGLLLSTWLLGAAPGSALFCAAWLRGRAGERWLTSLAIAGCLGFSLWLLFAVLLRANLYHGVLGRLIG